MPQTDHFKFSTPDLTLDEHITGQPGLPTQATAALGSTTGPLKTTIRLVSAPNSKPTLSPELGTPQLRPVDPPFDLVMASADESGIPVWPLSPQPAPFERRLYPVLPANELDEARQHQAKSKLPENAAHSQVPVKSTKELPNPWDELPENAAHSQAPVNSTKELPNPWDKLPENAAHPQAPVSSKKELPNPWDKVQDLFSPAPKLPGKGKESTGIPRSEPFLFGSPLPRHSVSNKAFDTAAASVLEEMNKRLSAAGAQKVTTDVFGTIPVVTAATNRDSGSLHAQEMIDRFDKVHEEQFNKMDSIANHYAARRGVSGSKKRKSDVLGHGSAPARKRSSADTHVVGTSSRGRMGIPGGFNDEEEVMDDVQEEGDRRMSKRVRVLEEDGGKDKGRRLTISPKKTDAEEKQAERERAATRKMLEMRKDKRRSSRHARMSIGPQATSSTSLPPLANGNGVTDGANSCRQGQGDASLRNFVFSQVHCAQRMELRHRLAQESLADKHGDSSDQIQDCYCCGRAKGNKAPATSEEAFSPSSVATIGKSRYQEKHRSRSHRLFCIKQGIGRRSSKRRGVLFPIIKLADQLGDDEDAKPCASGIDWFPSER